MDIYDFLINMINDKELISIYDMDKCKYVCRGVRSEYIRNNFSNRELYEFINHLSIDDLNMCIQINI